MESKTLRPGDSRNLHKRSHRWSLISVTDRCQWKKDRSEGGQKGEESRRERDVRKLAGD